MRTEIRTTGYQGESIERFMNKLRSAGIEVLIDVRGLALSRKRGFSKRALKENLELHGIAYMHVPGLGMPKELRAKRHDLSDNAPILNAYDQLLPSRQDLIEELMEAIAGRKGCLMCFEADESQCHRSRLSTYLSARYPSINVEPLLEPALTIT